MGLRGKLVVAGLMPRFTSCSKTHTHKKAAETKINTSTMGKSSRTPRIKEKRKADPLGGVRHLDIGQHSALRESKILPVVKNISSLDASERVQAVTAIANLVEDPTCRKLLLKERIVITLMEKTLNDSSPEVVVRGWGALRNLAVEEGYDVCLHMYRKDILTPLAAAIPKVQNPTFFVKHFTYITIYTDSGHYKIISYGSRISGQCYKEACLDIHGECYWAFGRLEA